MLAFLHGALIAEGGLSQEKQKREGIDNLAYHLNIKKAEAWQWYHLCLESM